MKIILEFFKKLVLGNTKENKKLIPAIKNQCLNLKRVWNNETYSDFGIERILRLFLVSIQFIFPGLYIRHISGKLGFKFRKIFVELWVLIKLLLPIIILKFKLASNVIIFYITFYLLIETIIYLFGLIFLTDTYARPVSSKRSILALIMYYLEITFDFAVLYCYLSSLINNFFNETQTIIGIVYFSFVTSATLGYGDIFVKDDLGRVLVIFQIVTSFIFVVIFFNYFSTNSKENKYFTDNKKA